MAFKLNNVFIFSQSEELANKFEEELQSFARDGWCEIGTTVKSASRHEFETALVNRDKYDAIIFLSTGEPMPDFYPYAGLLINKNVYSYNFLNDTDVADMQYYVMDYIALEERKHNAANQ